MNEPPGKRAGPEVGLCAHCSFARVQLSARGSTFWRCARADADPSFSRYPALPVRACAGFEAGSPETRQP
jgi:hypothetical protein